MSIGLKSVESGSQDVAAFYDIRGEADSKYLGDRLGFTRYPLYLAEPFRYAETLVAQKAQGRPISLLDIGCGTGLHALKFASFGMEVTGVDLSFKSIQSAQAAAQRLNFSCRFVCEDVLNFLQTSTQEYDVIYAGACLYYFDIPTVLDLLKKRLKPGGMFICIETYGGNPVMNGLRKLRAKLRGDRDSATLHQLLRRPGIEILLKGFKDSRVQYFDALTLGGVVFSRIPVLGSIYHSIARRIDRVVLNRFGLSATAFRFVLIGTR